MSIYEEKDVQRMTGEDLLYAHKWSGCETRQMVEAEVRRRLEEWDVYRHPNMRFFDNTVTGALSRDFIKPMYSAYWQEITREEYKEKLVEYMAEEEA